MTWEAKVHSDRDSRAWCGHPHAREVTADRERITCGTCLALVDGEHPLQVNRPSGYQWADVQPCGTEAAYRRHLRHEGKPVRCRKCLAALRRRNEDRKAAAA